MTWCSGARARAKSSPPRLTRLRGALRFLDAFVCLKHVLDITLEYQKIWGGTAVNFDGAPVIPLNSTFDLLAIEQHNNHQCMSIDLLLVVKDFRACFRRRRHTLA